MTSVSTVSHSTGVQAGQTRTRDGTRLVYSLRGPANAQKRIALVHSLAMDGTFWQPVAERLAETACVLTYDCRGHGGSDKPAGPYTVELFADDLADLLDHLGWRSAVVAGASMGGCVSLAFAARHPARTAGLGLIDTTAWYNAMPAWQDRANKARTEGLASLIGFQVTRWFSDAFRAEHPDVVQACVDVFLRNDLPAYAETCLMLGACDLRAALPGITVPTAVIVGEEDYAAPVAMSQVMHDGIKGSSLTVLEKARHLTPLERPDVIAAALDRLMEAGCRA